MSRRIPMIRGTSSLAASALTFSFFVSSAHAQVAPEVAAEKPAAKQAAKPKPAPATTNPAAPAAPEAKATTDAAAVPAKDPFEEAAVPEAPPQGSSTEDQAVPEATAKPEVEAEAVPAVDEKGRPLSEPRIIDTSKKTDEPIAEEDLPPQEPAEQEPDYETVPFTHHMRHLDLAVGVRVVGTPNDGLEPFLETPAMGEVYLRAGGAFALVDRFALAGLIEAGTGTVAASVRGQDSELEVSRLTLGVEGRYHFMHRLYAYGRLAPGFEFVKGTIGFEGDSDALTDKDTSFQLDGALGAAIRFAGSSNGERRVARFWAFVEGGARLAGGHELSLAIDPDSDGPSRAEPIELDKLNTSGAFFSTGVMMTF